MRYGYRHTAGVVLVLLLFFAGCTVSLAQVSSTGDLVNPTTTTSGSTWTNGVYQSSLTCWQGGDPGYCGPNAIVRPGNEINFSYGTTDLYQQVAIAQALPNSGTGLVVRGWNFGYTAKVGNGWDNGAYDYLQSYVQFRDAGGTIKESWSSIHTTTHNWTTYNYSGTFTERYTTQNLTTARFGFIGRDNNYWAGPYGPEVNNVSFSLQYAPDPCVNSQLSSPQCPRFMETLSQVTATPQSNSISLLPTTATSSSISTTTTATTNTPSNNSQSMQSMALSLIRNNEKRETALVQQTIQNSEASANVEQAPSTSADTTTTQQTNQNSGQPGQNPTASAMNMALNANLSNAANQTNSQANNGSLDSLLPPVNTAPTSSSSEIEIDRPMVQTQMANTNPMTMPQVKNTVETVAETESGSQLAVVPALVDTGPVNTELVFIQPVAPVSQINVEPQSTTATNLYRPPVQIENTPVANFQTETAVATNQVVEPTPIVQESTFEVASIAQTFTTDPANVLNQSQAQTTAPIAPTPIFSGPVVNTRTQDNDIAGGRGIESIAQVPQGFNVYASLTLRDAAFYAPREIYRGQRNVDNRRALSSLAQEGRHQEMVDQQYRR